jgi:SAM-dependent methyltransferase
VAKEELGSAAQIVLGDALDYLPRHPGAFDVIILNDVLEHFPPGRTVPVLRLLADALKTGGVLHVRVPNMSSLLASYSMHLDITHLSGFTEHSLMQALETAGFVDPRLVSSRPRLFWCPSRPARMALRLVRIVQWSLDALLHRALYLLRGQMPMPSETSINVEVYATKPA